MKAIPAILIFVVLFATIPAAAQTTVTKADTPIFDFLNVGSSWVGGEVPGADDVARFDSTMATEANNMNRLGGDMSVRGIRVIDPMVRNVSSGYSIAPSLTVSPFAYTGTLSIGGEGVDMGSALAPPTIGNWFFNIGCPIAITADQIWEVRTSSSVIKWDLALAGSSFSSSSPRRTVPTDLGGNTVTKISSGKVGVLFDRGFSNGTLVIDSGAVEFANAINPSTGTDIQLDIDSSLNVVVNSPGTLQISQAPTAGTGAVNWEANTVLDGGDLRLNGEEYTGNLTIGGELGAAPGHRGQIYYENESDSPDPITITIASRLVGEGTLILIFGSDREQDRILLAGNDSTSSGALTLWFGSTVYITNTSGSATGTARVTTLNGSVLRGTGTTGPVDAEGTIWPGIADGDTETLTTGAATISGALAIDIDGAANDRLVVNGMLALDSPNLVLNFSGAGFTEADYIIAEASSITGEGFANLPDGYAVTVVDGEAGQQLVVSAELDPFVAWMTKFLRIDPSKTGQLDDADEDGLSNVVEFVLDGNPDLSTRDTDPVVGVGDGALRYEFTRRKDAQAADYVSTVQYSTDLRVWTEVVASPVSSDDTTETLVATLPATARFARIQVTLPL